MVEKNLPSLKIHKLNQEQYDRLAAQGDLDAEALYLVDDDLAITTVITADSSHEEVPSAQAVYELCNKLIQQALNQ